MNKTATQTLSGKPVRIFEVFPGQQRPFLGAIQDRTGNWTVASWNANGRRSTGVDPTDLVLIDAPAKTRWKDKTRGGHPVRIYAEDGSPEWSIHGAIQTSKGWEGRSWRPDGTCYSAENCLIPATPIIDWSKQPDWCKAVAMDRYGVWWRYDTTALLKGIDAWLCDSSMFTHRMHPSEYPTFDGDWKDSLCVRPEGGKQ